MCGIAGVLRFDRQEIDFSVLKGMADRIAHRGPDSEGFWEAGYIGLAHRRLAIRDLSPAGHQPMQDPQQRVTVSYNGEIYNDSILRQELERETGYAFRSSCDAELLPIGWLTWGSKLFDKLEGMFAIAIWDSRTNMLILARDGIGIKPLYYSQSESQFLFSSEIKSILSAQSIPSVIDPKEFHHYLASGYPSVNNTLYQNIHQLPAGAILEISSEGHSQLRPFWKPKRQPDSGIHLKDATEELDRLLKTVINDMLISDVPVGLLQSSGIDSTLLALLTPSYIKSYTAQFKEASHDESQLAREIAAYTHHEWKGITVDLEDHLIDDVYRVAHHVDHQLADSSCLAHFILSRLTRHEVKVALSGDGADEIFAGYNTYQATRIASPLSPLFPPALANPVIHWLGSHYAADESRLPWHEKWRRFLAGMVLANQTPHPQWRRLMYPDLSASLYGPALRECRDLNPMQEYETAIVSQSGSVFDQSLLGDQTYYLPGDMLAKVDRMSMAHGLEIRVPFLDRRMIELASRLPTRCLSPILGPTKRILRNLVDHHQIPSRISKAPKKGFNLPLAQLLRTALKPLGDQLFIQEADKFYPLLEPVAIQQIWNDHLIGKANHAYVLWSLIIFGAR